jgi:Uma2 family endonuclease
MNIAVTHTADDLPPRRAFTAEDIRRMMEAGVISEDENIELIEGEIVMMAAKGYAHEIIKKGLNITLVRALPAHLDMSVEMTIQFADNTILEPDIAVFERGALSRSDTGFCHLPSGDLLLAIEVAVSSLAYDRGLKAKLYARHGVREFWVIDANERKTWVHTGPSGDAWTSIIERDPADTLTTDALPGLAVRLADID